MDVKATPKFFKRTMPYEEVMELHAQSSEFNPGTVFIFLRDNSDSDKPSRIRISVSTSQARDFANRLLECASRSAEVV